MQEIVLGEDTAVLTVANGTATLRPTVRYWNAEISSANFVRLTGSLPAGLIETFPLESNDGTTLQFTVADRSLQSGRPVGCQVTFLRCG